MMGEPFLVKILLLGIGRELPPLLVSAIGLVLLHHHLRPDALRRLAAWGLWIVLGGSVLNLVVNSLLPLLFLNNIPYEHHETIIPILRTVNFGIVLLKATGYGLLVRAVVLVLRSLPAKQ